MPESDGDGMKRIGSNPKSILGTKVILPVEGTPTPTTRLSIQGGTPTRGVTLTTHLSKGVIQGGTPTQEVILTTHLSRGGAVQGGTPIQGVTPTQEGTPTNPHMEGMVPRAALLVHHVEGTDRATATAGKEGTADAKDTATEVTGVTEVTEVTEEDTSIDTNRVIDTESATRKGGRVGGLPVRAAAIQTKPTPGGASTIQILLLHSVNMISSC